MKQMPSIVSFLIPFASKKVKKNWVKACDDLQATLSSILNSTNPNLNVVIVGNEYPTFNVESDSRVKFISLDSHSNVQHDSVISGRLDILRKMKSAYQYADQNFKPSYFMRCDADDLISNRLVQWLETAPSSPGFLINLGWVWDQNKYLIQYSERHDRMCGTCLVIRNDYAKKEGPFLTNVDGVEFNEEQLAFSYKDKYSLIPGSKNTSILFNDSHTRFAAQFKYFGVDVKKIPFAAVVYKIRNQDSLSFKFDDRINKKYTFRECLGKWRRMRFISKKLKAEFALME